MTGTMRAWRFVGAGQPLRCEDVPVPVPGDGDVVVAVRAAGLCHSDLHIVDGDFESPCPLTLGHEGAGEVVALGPGVEQPSVGTRVAIYGAVPCGDCRVCRADQPNLCPERGHLGLARDGSFAEFAVCRAAGTVALPPAVSFDGGAVAVDAVLTAYHALFTIGRVQPGERVAIFGIGGLGHNAVQLAVDAGATVIAVDPEPAKREAALGAGASGTRADGRALALEFDVAADFVGSARSIEEAQLAVRPGGRTVVAGLGTRRAELLAMRLGAHEVALLGSYWGTLDELRQCLRLIAAGRITPRTHARPLDSVNEQMERLRRGEVVGRVVLHSHD